jgi:hypothetical protein
VGLAVAAPEEDLLALYGAPGEGSVDPALLALGEAIPGTPGEDYPIYSTPPETSFTCDDGKIEGYYADPEAECQSFHICANDGNGGLLRYPFLCPNGTVFNQNYFICDWWFNFDCSTVRNIADSVTILLCVALSRPRITTTGTRRLRRLRRRPRRGPAAAGTWTWG